MVGAVSYCGGDPDKIGPVSVGEVYESVCPCFGLLCRFQAKIIVHPSVQVDRRYVVDKKTT